MAAETGIDARVVDFDVLGAWMTGQGLPGGAFEGVELLAGGTQNVLVRFTRGGREYVLRRGPEHLRPKSNEVMRREARVLTALDGTDVPHPRFIAGCLDEAVMHGAVFYLMEAVDGFNPGRALPPLHAADAGVRREMGLRIADGAAALGRVDHLAVGLAAFGQPQGFIERQVPRWLGELESYRRFEGYPGPAIPGVDRVAAWLDDNRPSRWTPGIMHGDYHFANVLYAHDGPRLAAIVDWEMCTIGDPLLDLGWLLATWPDGSGAGPGVGSPLAAAGGLPSTAEVVARYGEGSARDLSGAGWYGVLACFKLGIVLEGTHARASAGLAPKATGDLLHATTLALFERARAMIAGA
ncbi:MAG: phosphotransferase family protein [Dehalococcoidia bacterium]|nr:phosphotransferase family protein [Dehalococcoidia bacterium]